MSNEARETIDYHVPRGRRRFYAWRRRPQLRLISRHAPDAATCADVGSADGALGELLLERALISTYVGFEIDPNLRDFGNRVGLDLRAFDAERSQLPGQFDLILCSHLLEHVSDPASLLRRLQPSLAANGVLIVAAPNLSSICARLMGKKWIGFRDPTHISLHTHDEWFEMLESQGFAIVFAGSSYLSDLPWWGTPGVALSKLLFFAVGYARWRHGNSSIFVARARH